MCESIASLCARINRDKSLEGTYMEVKDLRKLHDALVTRGQTSCCGCMPCQPSSRDSALAPAGEPDAAAHHASVQIELAQAEWSLAGSAEVQDMSDEMHAARSMGTVKGLNPGESSVHVSDLRESFEERCQRLQQRRASQALRSLSDRSDRQASMPSGQPKDAKAAMDSPLLADVERKDHSDDSAGSETSSGREDSPPGPLRKFSNEVSRASRFFSRTMTDPTSMSFKRTVGRTSSELLQSGESQFPAHWGHGHNRSSVP